MAGLSVPAPYRKALRELATLPDESAERLIAALQAVAPFQTVEELRTVVRDALGQDDGELADWLIPALLSLSGQLRGEPGAQLAAALSESADLDLPSDVRTQLRSRMEDILATDALKSTAIAVELLTQHDRNYQTARVLTDIRPVFQSDVHDRPNGTVIVETLQLQTWDREGNSETLYIAMDKADLLELKSVIDRALEKTDTIDKWLGAQGIARFELDRRAL